MKNVKKNSQCKVFYGKISWKSRHFSESNTYYISGPRNLFYFLGKNQEKVLGDPKLIFHGKPLPSFELTWKKFYKNPVNHKRVENFQKQITIFEKIRNPWKSRFYHRKGNGNFPKINFFWKKMAKSFEHHDFFSRK